MTTNADGGPGSLRAVVSGANNGDVINFDPRIAGTKITLTSGQINLNKSLTIDGQTNSTTIDGGGSYRIFYNPLSSLTEEIDDLTLSNGKVTVGGHPTSATVGRSTTSATSPSNTTPSWVTRPCRRVGRSTTPGGRA